MLDFGFSELLFIVALCTILLGPDEIPKVMRLLGRIVRRLQYVRYAFSQQFEEFLREHDLDDIRKQVNFERREFDESAEDESFIQSLPPPLGDENEEEKAEEKPSYPG